MADARRVASALALVGWFAATPALAHVPMQSLPASQDAPAVLHGVPDATRPIAYDRAARTLYIGSEPESGIYAPGATVTVDPAASIVGNFVRARPALRPADTAGLKGNLPSGMPVNGAALTSGFGMRTHPLLGTQRLHSGVDLATPAGSPIYATSDGIVRQADWNGGYGLYVAVDHGGGLQTRYGHMSRLNVSSGQRVRKGELIGFVGSTGLSTGPHLHYEVRQNGVAVDPSRLLRK